MTDNQQDHPLTTYPCSDCDRSFPSKASVDMHHRRVHENWGGNPTGKRLVNPNQSDDAIIADIRKKMVTDARSFQPATTGLYPCPECGDDSWASPHALSVHRSKAHGHKSQRGSRRQRAIAKLEEQSSPLTYTEIPGFKVLRDSNGDIWLAERWGDDHA